MTPLRATHLITSLDADGAQRVLVRVLRELGSEAGAMDVISMRPLGPFAEELTAIGVRVRSLNMQRGVPSFRAMWQLTKWLRSDRPALLATWLYHANLLGAVVQPLVRRVPIVWNVRNDARIPSNDGRWSGRSIQLGSQLAKWSPERIVFCAESSRDTHCQLGYPRERTLVVANGFDTHRFRPSLTARGELRRELGLAADTPLVGKIGRYHPDKDHQTFVAAASRIAEQRPGVHFVLCGRDVTHDNVELTGWLTEARLTDRTHLLGSRDDVEKVAAALDLGVSSSATEAFSNAIGEIMACGVPCVVTDVGDSAKVVGDAVRVVPPKQPESLSRACLDVLALDQDARTSAGDAARRRIENYYGLQTMTRRHLDVWRKAARLQSLPKADFKDEIQIQRAA